MTGREDVNPYTVPLFTPEGEVNRQRLPWELEPSEAEAVANGGPAASPAHAEPGAAQGYGAPARGGDGSPPSSQREAEEGFSVHEVKSRIHRHLLERLNLSNLESYDRSQVVAEIRKVVQDLLVREAAPLNLDEREALVEQVLHEIFGLGPLEPLLQDPNVSDIL